MELNTHKKANTTNTDKHAEVECSDSFVKYVIKQNEMTQLLPRQLAASQQRADNRETYFERLSTC